MWADDLALVREMVAKYGPLPAGPVVDVGGLERPCVADYSITTRKLDELAEVAKLAAGNVTHDWVQQKIAAAQQARYLDIHLPLSFLGDYACENPSTGGLSIEDLWTKYDGVRAPKIGTAILLSVLEHVGNPFECAELLRDAMADGGLVIVSVPFCFPYHPSPRDLWRFSPDGLRAVFERCEMWEVLEADWRLDVPAEAGVIDIKTGRAQTIQSCYCVCKAT